MWGTTARQRLRLAPLYAALRAADVVRQMRGMRDADAAPAWRPGITVVIPDRDAPEMLSEALIPVQMARERVDEPLQIVVVANGAPLVRYADVQKAFPEVELVHIAEPLGFSAAISRGVACARHEWTFLMNN